MRRVVPIVLALLAFAALSLAAAERAPAGPEKTTVAIQEGRLSGDLVGDSHDVVAYRGIPYAKPPVGDLRWRPPQPVDPWQGVRAATEYGPGCPHSL